MKHHSVVYISSDLLPWVCVCLMCVSMCVCCVYNMCVIVYISVYDVCMIVCVSVYDVCVWCVYDVGVCMV